MRMKKTASVLSLLVVSVCAHAGMFGDSGDFRCGRDDVVKAVRDTLRDDASAKLQTEFITQSGIFTQPRESYSAALANLQADVRGVSTLSQNENGATCTATLSIPLPENALIAATKIPGLFDEYLQDGGAFSNSHVTWKNYSYRIRLADNKKDITVSDMDNIAAVMTKTAWAAVNKDQLINQVNAQAMADARRDYESEDARLNAVWKDLPDAVRAAMKTEQVNWVSAKTRQCGKISDTRLESVAAERRAEIFKCQTQMTTQRIDFLSSNSNELRDEN
ncbi:lysozyme inhibitor LprI family protein [Enterobacter ludwigii]|uniref:lysozyme inhibitor LprI family protein n=1 Tax=Enterobacter ludwigii TaxID=299767 RepID=UPI0018675CFE|nr:lysozyme inhibitor LprI family protein [Enterobacter ludwigii]